MPGRPEMGRPRLTIRTQTHSLDVSIENDGVRREMETMEKTNEKYYQGQAGRKTTPTIQNDPSRRGSKLRNQRRTSEREL